MHGTIERTSTLEVMAKTMAAADSGPIGSPEFNQHWAESREGYLVAARAAIEGLRSSQALRDFLISSSWDWNNAPIRDHETESLRVWNTILSEILRRNV